MVNKILDNLKIGIAIIDKDLKLKYINRYLKDLIIDDENDFEKIQKRFGDAFNCRNIGIDIDCGSSKSCNSCEVTPLFKTIYSGEEGVLFDIEVFADRFKVNQKGKFELKGYPVYIDGEKFIQLELHEVTEKKMLEKNLQIKENIEKKLQLFLDTIEDYIFFMDRDGRFEYCNNSYLEYLGKSYEEVIGNKESDLVPLSMAKKCIENTVMALEYGTFFQEENFFEKWYQTFKGRVELEDGSIGILAIVRDITIQKTRELELKERAYVDMLTGLFNRNFFEEKIAKNMNHKGAIVIVIDADNFKTINDTLGHEAGDRVLKSLADIIKINIRKEDYAVRMGGDEFLIFTNSGSLGAKKIAERILESARAIRIQNISVSLSIGIGEDSDGDGNLAKIMKMADEALYESKSKGKNTLTLRNKVSQFREFMI